jgi:hypothetical protein
MTSNIVFAFFRGERGTMGSKMMCERLGTDRAE